MAYSTLLFDFDHTLFDSDASEAAAYAATLTDWGVADPAVHFDTYRTINQGLWAGVERGEIGPADVHTRRFEEFTVALGLDADPVAMSDDYAVAMGAHGELYPGVLALLEQFADTASMALVTNGLGAIQRARIERTEIARFFDAIVISAEVDAAKPATEIFDITFDRLGGPSKESALMIGDNLRSDIGGGTNYGIATCWLNWRGATSGEGDRVTHEIAALDQLLPLIAAQGPDHSA